MKKVYPKKFPIKIEYFLREYGKVTIVGVYKYLGYRLLKLSNKLIKLKKIEFFNNNNDSTLKPEITKENDQIKWFEKNINFFKQKLSNIEKSHTFITPKYRNKDNNSSLFSDTIIEKIFCSVLENTLNKLHL